MIINFRQGIISAQSSQSFINLNEGRININANTKSVDIAFAYGQANYLFSEVEDVIGAWGPFNSGTDYWIYWNIDLRTGVRTFGSTTLEPSFGAILPTNPRIDQHFFDTREKKMKVWNGFSWDYKLRVFAGKVQGGSTLMSQSFGTQVGISGNYPIGYILFDSANNPVKRNDLFITTEDRLHTQYDNKNSYKLDGLLIDGTAMESIPAYHCVSWKGARQIGVTSNVTYQYPCIGISAEPAAKNEVTKFITKGMVTNFNNWNWSEPANTPLFVGSNGEITTSVPQGYSLQKIGHIVSPDTIFVDIQEIILIDEVYVPVTPSPTPSLSASPTPTPSTSQAAIVNADYVSVFYQNNQPALALNPDLQGTTASIPSSITLSAFDGVNFIDIGESAVSWAVNGDGSEAIGTKALRKLRGLGNYLTVNVPDDFQVGSDISLNQSVVYDGSFTAYSGPTSDKAMVMQNFVNGEPTPYVIAYAIDKVNGFEYTLSRINTSYLTNDITIKAYHNGTEINLTVDPITANINYFGMSGLEVLEDGTPFSIAQDSTVGAYFIKLILSNYDSTANTANISFDYQFLPYSMPIQSLDGPLEVYEVKSFGNKQYISVAATVSSLRQTYRNSCNDQFGGTSVNPFILVYNNDTAQIETAYYDGYQSGYITITDNYLFNIASNFDNTFNFQLNAYSIDSNNVVTLVDMIHGTALDGMPCTDMRLRSVRTDSNTITVYTFGGGIFKFDGTTFTDTGVAGFYSTVSPINSISSGSCIQYGNSIIDTWVGKLNPYPLPSLSASITPTPTPTPTPSSRPILPPSNLSINNLVVAPLGKNNVNYVFQCDSLDDDFRQVGPLPFDFYFNGINYGNGQNGGIFVGSNSYVTFGAGKTDYDITPTTPGAGILIHADDNSAQYIGTIGYNDYDGFTIRYEGTYSSSGNSDTINMIWEVTFYEGQYIQVTIGSMARGTGDGVSGICDGTSYTLPIDFAANTSYVIYDVEGSNGSGKSWAYQVGSITGASAPLAAIPVPGVSANLTALDSTDVPYSDILNLNLSGTVYKLKTMSDGQLFVSGSYTSLDGSSYSNLALLNSDLTINTSFAAINPSAYPSSILETTNAIFMAIPDSTTVSGNTYSGIFKLNKDYSLDGSYVCPFASGYGTILLQTADGKIYLGGSSITPNGYSSRALARLNSDGTFDTTYSITISGYYGGTFDTTTKITAIYQTSDGKIYIGGSFQTVGGSSYNCIARLNSDGTIDNTFAALTPVFDSNISDPISKILQTPDGKIYVTGRFYTVNGTVRVGIIRLNSDGTLDTSFSMDISPANEAIAVYDIEQINSHLYITGSFNSVNSNNYSCIARLNLDGTLDTAFENIPSDITQTPAMRINTIQSVGNKTVFGGTFLNKIGYC